MEIEQEVFAETYEGGRIGFAQLSRKRDPQSLAAFNLQRTLEKYPAFTKEARQDIQNEFSDFPDLPVLNLEMLASVLDFLKDHSTPTPADFEDDVILEYFSRLLPDKLNPKERERVIIRLKASFLRYIRAISSFRRRDED